MEELADVSELTGTVSYVGSLPMDDEGRLFIRTTLASGRIVVYDPARHDTLSFGPNGPGPGSFDGALSLFVKPPDTLYAFDGHSSQLMVFGPGYDLIREIQSALQPTSIAFQDDGSAIVAAQGETASTFPHPLHQLSPRGDYRSSFGGRTGQPATRLDTRMGSRHVAISPDGRIWTALRYNYDLEERSTNGTSRTLRRRPAWFPTSSSPGDGGPAYPIVAGIQIDDAGRLWILAWRQAPGDPKRLTPTGGTATNVRETVIEVIDPGEARVLASTVVPELAIGFARGGTIFTYSNEGREELRLWQLSMQEIRDKNEEERTR
jgi:hypothetical protein